MNSWKPSTEPVNAYDFQKAITAHQVVVIHFWADWNAVDREMDAVLLNLRSTFTRKALFYSFDTTPEENHDICRLCKILNLPALVCFIEGRLHETFIGLMPEKELETKVTVWITRSQSQEGSVG